MNKKLKDFKEHYNTYIYYYNTEEKQFPEFYTAIKIFLMYLDNPELIKSKKFQNILDVYFSFLKSYSNSVEFFLPYHPEDYYLDIFNIFQKSLNSSKFAFNRERYNRAASETLINKNIESVKASLLFDLGNLLKLIKTVEKSDYLILYTSFGNLSALDLRSELTDLFAASEEEMANLKLMDAEQLNLYLEAKE